MVIQVSFHHKYHLEDENYFFDLVKACFTQRRKTIYNNFQNFVKDKALAKELLEILKGKISELDHWTEKEETQAEVDNIIRDTLWCELPESYDDRLLNEYRRKIYEFVYSTYPAA
mgnify:CR=1 FL=1